MWYYYLVDKIGSGSNNDPYRPNVPEGTPFVGQECPYGKFLIKTGQPITGLQDIVFGSKLENICYNNRLKYSDIVLEWYID